MELSSQSAKRLFKQPGPFAIAVIKQFRANQGILLAGAVAYYTLLSLVPLLILILLALSHVVDEERLLITLRASLEFVVPGQADALVGQLRNFFTHRQVVGSVLLLTLFFFSALAFSVLDNAMSVIFFHRKDQTAAFPRISGDALRVHRVSRSGLGRDGGVRHGAYDLLIMRMLMRVCL